QDGQHGSIGSRIQESIAMPRCREWTGLRLAVAHDARNYQVRVVERGAMRVSKSVAEFTAFMNGTRRFWRRMARNSTWERKLPKKTAHSLSVLRDRRIDFAVGPFKIRIGHHPGTAMPGTADIDDVEVMNFDDPVEVGIDEIEPWRRAPVSQQPRLNMLWFQGLLEQWIVEQIDLPYREIVRGSPIGVETR